MNTDTNKDTIATVPLYADELNCELAECLVQECKEAGEPTSYNVSAEDIFERWDLKTKESCVIIALPGLTSADVSPSVERPRAVVLRERADGKGTAYLQLRNGHVLLKVQTMSQVAEGSRYLVLYLFNDRPVLDIIPATKALEMDMDENETSAKSYVPLVEERAGRQTGDPFHLPVIVRRAATLAAEPALDDYLDTSIDDENSIPF